MGVLGLAALGAVAGSGAKAQGAPSSTELLKHFAEEQATPGGPEQATSTLTHILVHRSDHSPGTIQDLRNGLEDLALRHGNAHVRQAAVIYLTTGSRFKDSKPEPGMFARLNRVYDRSQDGQVRAMVVLAMGGLAERKASVAFLDKIARQDPTAEEFPNAALWALRALPAMGDEGRAELKLLHESKAVVHPEARHGLDVLARKGYKTK
jgi:hypothetical protein